MIIGTGDWRISSIDSGNIGMYGCCHFKGSIKHCIPIEAAQSVVVSSDMKSIGYSIRIACQTLIN